MPAHTLTTEADAQVLRARALAYAFRSGEHFPDDGVAPKRAGRGLVIGIMLSVLALVGVGVGVIVADALGQESGVPASIVYSPPGTPVLPATVATP